MAFEDGFGFESGELGADAGADHSVFVRVVRAGEELFDSSRDVLEEGVQVHRKILCERE